ncbi:MAG TPA: iron chelate uptake ABC transporter family permease subunit [Candidatus Limnocylindrales bacterium]|nr:iron chelate uptake ABC transporter family permease subunit [Candidatus Limnocylindrales bacterium]
MSAGVAARPRSAARPAWLEALRHRPLLLAVTGLVALAFALVAGLALGNVSIPIGDTVAIIGHNLLGWPAEVTWAASAETIVLELRLPRVITAMAVGAALSLAGATFQGLLRNPLADPYVLGTASGAALGAAIALLVPVQFALLGFGLLHVLAFTGALLAVAVVYRVSRLGGLNSLTSVLLTGYAIGSLLAAGLAMTMYLSGSNLRQIFFYLLGSFSLASWPQVVVGLPIIAIGSVVILSRARILNGLLLGEETAAHLGIDVRRERLLLLGAATLITAAAVALSGLIGFVGLVIPHLVRLVVGPNARSLLPLSVIYGAAFMAVADLIARIPGELPVGIVTAIIGAPFFLYLLRTNRAGYQL